MKRNTLRNKTRIKRRKQNKKTRRIRRMRGGFIDDQKSVDFNPNLAYDAKQMGGIGQMGGQNLGAGCPDPNFSIYNTNELSLFPYRPT
jgi:hypothetical protein